MRPSNEQGVVAILDTLPECKVILDALDDPEFPMPPMEQGSEGFADSFGVRFRSQTMHEPRPPAADAYVEPVFNPSPEFKVEARDVDFVSQAAKRVIEDRDLKRLLFNRTTKRTEAAKTILGFFE